MSRLGARSYGSRLGVFGASRLGVFGGGASCPPLLVIGGLTREWDGSAYTYHQSYWVLPRQALPDLDNADIDDYGALPVIDGLTFNGCVGGITRAGPVVGATLYTGGTGPIIAQLSGTTPDDGPTVSPTWEPTPVWSFDVKAEWEPFYGYDLDAGGVFGPMITNCDGYEVNATCTLVWDEGAVERYSQGRLRLDFQGDWLNDPSDGILVSSVDGSRVFPTGRFLVPFNEGAAYDQHVGHIWVPPSNGGERRYISLGGDGYAFYADYLSTATPGTRRPNYNADRSRAYTLGNDAIAPLRFQFRSYDVADPLDPDNWTLDDTLTLETLTGDELNSAGGSITFLFSIDGDLHLFAVYTTAESDEADTTITQYLKAVLIDADAGTLVSSVTLASSTVSKTSGGGYALGGTSSADFDSQRRCHFAYMPARLRIESEVSGPTVAATLFCVDMEDLTTVWSKAFGGPTDAETLISTVSVSF